MSGDPRPFRSLDLMPETAYEREDLGGRVNEGLAVFRSKRDVGEVGATVPVCTASEPTPAAPKRGRRSQDAIHRVATSHSALRAAGARHQARSVRFTMTARQAKHGRSHVPTLASWLGA